MNDAKNANAAASSDTAPSALQFLRRFPLHWNSCTVHQILREQREQSREAYIASNTVMVNGLKGAFGVVVLGNGAASFTEALVAKTNNALVTIGEKHPRSVSSALSTAE